MSADNNAQRTLGGLSKITADQIELSSNVDSITIDGFSGDPKYILRKNATTNKIEWHSLSVGDLLNVVSPLVESSTDLSLNLNLLTTTTNTNANDFFVYVNTSGATKKMTISSFLGAILSTILPNTNNAIDLGSSGKRWREIFTEKLQTDDIQSPTGSLNIATGTNVIGNFTIGGSSDANDRPEIYADGVEIYDGLEMNSDITPDTNNSRDIGSSSKKFRHIYAHELTLDTGMNMNSNIIPSTDNTFDLGSASKRVRNVYTHTLIADVLSGTTISGNLIPTANNSSVIGASDKKLNNIHKIY